MFDLLLWTTSAMFILWMLSIQRTWSRNVSEATACRKSLSVYVCLVDIAFIAAGLSVLPQRHTLLDMILSAPRECCMLMAILIYMAMPLPTVLGHSFDRKDRSSWTIAAIFPALLAMLVFPVVRHDAICAGNLHCYLFGLCKVAMILSYQCLGLKTTRFDNMGPGGLPFDPGN